MYLELALGPKLMTVATMLIGLVPLLWATTSGADAFTVYRALRNSGEVSSIDRSGEVLSVLAMVDIAGRDEVLLGRFALDFVVARNERDEWECHAIEINLRKGGTTHPFLTLQFLTDGTYDPETATFTAPSGKQKFFVASDHVESPAYRGLTPDDLFDIVVRHGLHFDQSVQTGIVFHMMAALTESGHVGMTAVGNSPEEARELYERAVAILDAEAAESLAERPLPDS